MRLSGRVVEIVTDELSGKPTKLTIGNIEDGLANRFQKINNSIAAIGETVMDINGGTMSTADYLSRLIDRLNTEINATGGYTYITEGEGLRTYDRAVSDPLVGTEANAVVEIKGGTIRIANSKTATGEWRWKTVFTSGHVAAEVVTAAAIVTGYIGSAGATFIDLDNATVQLGSSEETNLTITSSGAEINDANTRIGFFGSENNLPTVKLGDDFCAIKITSDAIHVEALGADLMRIGHEQQASGYIGSPFYEFGGLATGVRAFSHGADCESSGDSAVTFGSNNVASGIASFAAGRRNEAAGNDSLAIGNGNSASGRAAVALGYETTASAQAAFAAGWTTKATEVYATALGLNTTASGSGALATGYNSIAYGNNSIAGGSTTNARGNNSFAIGYKATTNYEDSAAIGTGVETSGKCQTAVGKYNTTHGDQFLFIVGKGTESSKSDAFYVRDNGNMWCAGTLTQASDKRLKKHVSYLGDEAAAFVRDLKPALFEKDGERRLGFYAQDVEKADRWQTSTVSECEADERLGAVKSLDYSALIAPLVAYCQKLEKRLEGMQVEIDNLYARYR